MLFQYKAKTKKGKTKTGTIQAVNRTEARKELLAKDLILLSMRPAKKPRTLKLINLIPIIGHVSNLDKVLFAKHLSIMIRAGLTIREGVATMEEQTSSRRFKKVLKDVIDRLDNGESLGESLARHPKIFNELFINMIRVGEASGTLEENLGHLAIHLEKIYDLRKKVIAASIYPSIVLVATFGLAGALSIFVLPKLIPLFRSFKVELPLVTRVLLWLVEAVQDYGLFIFCGLIIFIVAIVLLSQLRPIKRLNHKLLLSLPILKSIVKNTNLAQLTRTLGTLLRSGISVIEALDITAKTNNNLIYQKALEETSTKVRKGKPIFSFFKTRPKLFPATVSRMVQVGEKSGNLEETLLYLAEFYEKEVDNTTKNLSNILEPILLIIIGLVVALVAISIILPIYQITRSLQIQ